MNERSKTWHAEDPFSSPNGGALRFYAQRRAISEPVTLLLDRLEAGRFAPGIAFVGARGSGKTIELRRIGDELLQRGIAPVHFDVSHHWRRADPNSRALYLLEAVRSASAAAAPRARGKTTMTAKAAVPGIPVEFSVSHEFARFEPALAEELESLVRDLSGNGGLVFLVDEGDLLGPDDFEMLFRDFLRDAAAADFPMTVAVAGTTVGFLESLSGSATYLPRLVPAVMIPRLDLDGSRELLVMTAATAGQDWDAPWVDELAIACRGLPRIAQTLGSQMFGEISNGKTPAVAVRKVIEKTESAIRSGMGVSLADVWDEARIVSTLNPTGMDWNDLVSEVARISGLPRIESHRRLDRILASGIIDIDEDLRVTLMDRI